MEIAVDIGAGSDAVGNERTTGGAVVDEPQDYAQTIDDDALRDACSRFLNGHGQRRPAEQLAEIPADVAPDRYGDGGVVAELEREVAALLGMPAAVFLPSGTMAQQVTLRVHADRRGSRTVVFHPTCHLHLHEGQAHQRLHDLVGRPTGDAHRLLTIDDLRGIAETPAALLLELPQREIGGQLPGWQDLVEQVEWARQRDVAVHLDGARLWECTPFYERTPAEIAGLFDTVYVSFYKLLGGLAGCCLAGTVEVVADVREWRKRHGGTLFALWPYAASALVGLGKRLPRVPEYYAHARAIAEALRDVSGIEVVPDPPQTPMMHIRLQTSPEHFRAAALRLAQEQGVWTWPRSTPTDSPRVQRIELTVGDATLGFAPHEVRTLLQSLLP